MINILPAHISNLIAAGEVVDRPASVIKELVENAIDAGATEITVEIKRGGIELMRVTDNGSGMSANDAKLCFLRHATSKIREEEDLHSIKTLGFRGEALAAIAACSRLTVLTRTEDSIEGASLQIEGGEILEATEQGCPKGTTIVIRELFFNTPARRKFLKKETTEAAAVGALLEKLAISTPTVGVKYIKDGKLSMQTKGNGDLAAAMYGATGADFIKNAITLEYTLDGISVSGLICRPEHARINRSLQSYFVNARYVRSRTLQTAFEEGYAGEIPSGRYPCGTIFVKLSESAVDANVHPQKMEIKFSSETAVYNAVYHAVKNALLGKNLHREMNATKKEGFFVEATSQNFGKILEGVKAIHPTKANEPSAKISIPIRTEQRAARNTAFSLAAPRGEYKKIDVNAWEFQSSIEVNKVQSAPEKPSVTEEKEQVSLPDMTLLSDGEQLAAEPTFKEPSSKFVGEAFGTYVIAEVEEELWFIDKHAARERIIFEELKRTHQIESQRLLSPQVVVLGRTGVGVVEAAAESISKMGFEIEVFGDNSVLVRSVPMGVQGFEELLLELCDLIELGKRDITPKIYEEALHMVACKAAVKGNTSESPEALKALIKELAAMPDIRHCPHGRPVVSIMSKGKLAREFGR